jgi:hypothetical protein
MIATAARSRINIASAMADLSATGVGFAIIEAPATAEQRRLSRKKAARERGEKPWNIGSR